MASSHCLPSFLTSNQEKFTTSSTIMSPHLQPMKVPDRNETHSPLSLSFSESHSDFNINDKILTVIKKMLKNPKSSKQIPQNDPLNCGDNKLSKVPKKKEGSEKLSKPNKIQNEPTNLNKRPNKEIYEKNEICVSTLKKHVKGENGRIEKSDNHNEKELLIEKKPDTGEKCKKPCTSKQINSNRASIASGKALLSEKVRSDNVANQLEKMEKKSIFQDALLNDHIKPLISNIIHDKFSNNKQFDQLSDISLSTGQSSPSSNTKRSSKNQHRSILNYEKNIKEPNSESTFNAPKILKEKSEMSLNPDLFYTLLKSPTFKLASSEPQNKVEDSKQEFFHPSENHSQLISQNQNVNMSIEQINPLNILNNIQQDSLFDSVQVIQKTPIGSSFQIGVSKFVLNTKSKKTRGIPKQLWSPDLMNDEKLNKLFGKIEAITGREIKNQEKVIECLQKFNLNDEKLLENIKKNRFYYQNCFGLKQRVLRNRKNL